MEYLLTAREAREHDSWLIDGLGIDSRELMYNAALGVADVVFARGGKRVAVFCSVGNNGGDGLALASILHARGIFVSAFVVGSEAKLTSDARHYFSVAREVGCSVSVCGDISELDAAFMPDEYDTCVDALFGTGLSRDISGAQLRAVALMNAFDGDVVSVDIPSGLDTDDGSVHGAAVKADATVTFQAKKRGQYLFKGREYCGDVIVKPISEHGLQKEYPCRKLDYDDVRALLPQKAWDANKSANGRVLLFAGSSGMSGAALMAAAAALKAGCGLLSVACPSEVASVFSRLPEAMTLPWYDGEWRKVCGGDIAKAIDSADAVAIGPGLGGGAGIPSLLEMLLRAGKPLVIDADALNALSRERGLLELLHEKTVLTPHIGEMARLTAQDKDEIIASQADAALEFANKRRCTVLLKSAVSVIASHDGRCVVNTTGNNALARGGSGDVLTGIAVSLLAQGCAPFDAASAASYILGLSAERAVALLLSRLVSATDVIDVIDTAINRKLGG